MDDERARFDRLLSDPAALRALAAELRKVAQT
jgi:hypothetical protein